MTKGTFWIEEMPDGRTQIGVEDYDVEYFGGMDHEMICTLTSDNLERFREKLSETRNGSLEQMISEEFGTHLDIVSMKHFLDSNGIEYEYFTWTS